MRLLLLCFLLFTLGLNAQDVTDKYASVSPVQTQLDGYNTGDIDLFLSAYADSVKIYSFPNELTMEGKTAMRETYGSMFERMPDLHCRLINRTVMGNRILDLESVIWEKGKAPSEVIAIYLVEDGLITEVRFLRSNN